MCDCYNHPCSGCGEPLPVHLGDYNTGREEVEVFCAKCLPLENVTIFTVTKRWEREDAGWADDEPAVGWRMGIRSLTDNARANADDNVPNIASDFDRTEFGHREATP